MDKYTFLQIVQNPDMLNANMHDDLLDIAENYPYFQGVYALLSKLESHQDTTNQAAIRTANRNVLKTFLEINSKKKDKRELIDSLNLHTEQVNAFDKFGDLEELETQAEVFDEAEQTELEEINQDFKDEVIITEKLSIEKEVTDQISNEDLEEREDNIEINSVEEEDVIENSSHELEENDLPVFDEPDYLTDDTEIDIQINQIDTAKDLPDYKESTNKGSFFDAISDDEFPEVNFEEKEIAIKKTKKIFDDVEESDFQKKVTEGQQNKVAIKSEQEVPSSTTNTSEKEANPKKKELAYSDYHLAEGELLPPDTKISAKEIQQSPKNTHYEDYHLTTPQNEAKIIETKITESKTDNQSKLAKEETKEKPTGSFFDSF